MKALPYLPAIFLLASLLYAEDAPQTGGSTLPLPTDRKSAAVLPAERNPFGRVQIIAPTDDGPVQADTEEGRLRAMMLRMPVKGVSEGADGSRTLIIGSLTVSEGDELPPIFPQQLEQLVVREIGADKVIFAFKERAGSTQNRAFSVMFNLAPRVRYALPGDVQDAGSGRAFPLRGQAAAEGNEVR